MDQRTRKINNFFSENGTITIYLVIVFITLIIFVGLLVDLARISVAQNQLRRVANASARSVVADYETIIKQDFGLFSYAKGSETCDQDFRKYLTLNVASTEGQSFNLLDYRLENSKADISGPLNQQEILKKQILEDMKYKAPTELAVFVADKIRSIGRMFSFFQSKNVERKKLESIKEKQRQVKDISRDIEGKKHRLLNIEEEIDNKRENLRNTDDPKKREDLRAEIGELQRESRELKAELGADLTTCKKINQEIDIERVDLIGKGYTGTTDSDALDNKLRETNLSMNEGLKTAKNSIDESCAELNRDIERSIRALDSNNFAEIGLSAINVYAADQRSNEQQANKINLTAQENRIKGQVAGSVYQEYLQAVKKGPVMESPEDFEKENGKDIDAIIEKTKKIVAIEKLITDGRDELYVNEYVLNHFSYLTEPSSKKNALYQFYNSEAEFICYGEHSPRIKAVSEIYLIRWGLDTMAYLCFSKVPTDPLTRFIYSTVMGAIQGAIDTFKLIMGQEVAIAEMIDPTNPAGGNPLKDIRSNYKEHLRILLFLHEDANKVDGDAKLERVLKVIMARSGKDPADLKTILQGEVEVSIRMWFLPLAGIENVERGPFGTEIKDGRCYIIKEVEYGY